MKKTILVFFAILLITMACLSQTRKEKVFDLQTKISEAVNRNKVLIEMLEDTPEQTFIIAAGDTVKRIATVTVGEKLRIRTAMKANYDSISVWAAVAKKLIP